MFSLKPGLLLSSRKPPFVLVFHVRLTDYRIGAQNVKGSLEPNDQIVCFLGPFFFFACFIFGICASESLEDDFLLIRFTSLIDSNLLTEVDRLRKALGLMMDRHKMATPGTSRVPGMARTSLDGSRKGLDR